MSDRKLAILGIVAVVTVIWAVVQVRISKRPAKPEAPADLIPGLDTTNIGSIIVGTGEDAVTLKRRGKHFVVTNKDNYPAATSEINELITSCMDIKRGELYTNEADNHKDLGVTEEDARSIVKFMTPEPNSTLLAGVVIGKTREMGEGSYVRLISVDKASSDKVYVASDVPWIKSRAIDYMEQELISVNRDDINSVTVTLSDEEYTLRATKDSKEIVLENIPAGKKAKKSDCDSVFGALTSLRFDDVKKKSSNLTFDRQYVCRLSDSTVYTLRIAQEDKKRYVRCEASFTDTVTRPKQDASEEELKKKEAKLLARDKAKEFTAKHEGWIYEIPEWKAKNLMKKLSELVEDVKQPEKPKEPVKPEPMKEKPPAEPNTIQEGQLVEPNSVQQQLHDEPNSVKVEPMDEPNSVKVKELVEPNLAEEK